MGKPLLDVDGHVTGFHSVDTVRTIEHQWIELGDGSRLSARLRIPAAADGEPVAAVLEYVPYRKDDGTLLRDNRQHDHLAARGFAMVRVDIRGSGDSDGALGGEYLATELHDGVEVIDWISRQPWCNGRVGIMGISWGGFNALQIAALQPPALGAVVAVAATDDRYATDVHYYGGCVLASDMVGWSATMACFNARPATPRVVAAYGTADQRAVWRERWRQRWLERLEQTPIFVHDWLGHQRRDAFWEHGSVCEDYAAIRCPVLTVGGLADGYTDTVFRLAAGLEVPYRAIVGPWSHNYPVVGVPGPNIDFLGELVDFFDLHLRPRVHGDPGDPDRLVDVVPAGARAAWEVEPLRIWVQDHVAPAPFHSQRPGRWVTEPSWPSPNVSMQPQWLTAPGRLITRRPSGRSETVSATNTLTTGVHQGNWWGYAAPGQLPADQRTEEDPAFRFDGEPVAEPVDLVGIPELALRLSVDAPIAQVAVRLCDVAPHGSMLQISRGVLNLTHRNSHRDPEPMVPGELVDVVVTLDGLAHRLAAGHHLSLLITTSLWPLVWPSPTEVVLTLEPGSACELRLPVRSPAVADSGVGDKGGGLFGEPVTAPDQAKLTAPPGSSRTVTEDVTTGTVTVIDHGDAGTITFDDHRTAMSSTATDSWTITRGDPLSARVTCDRTWSVVWPEEAVAVSVESRSDMWCDATHFHTRDIVTTHVDNEVLFSRTYDYSVARDHQ